MDNLQLEKNKKQSERVLPSNQTFSKSKNPNNGGLIDTKGKKRSPSSSSFNNVWQRTKVSHGIKKRKSIHVGDICELVITALGPKNIGIDELSFGYSIFVPNAGLGEKIKAKIIKIGTTKNRLIKNTKYAIAKLLEKTKSVETYTKPPVKPGDILDVKILKFSLKGAGLVELMRST